MSSARIGIDLGGTKIAGVLLDAQRRVVSRLRLPTPRGDYAGTLACIAQLVRSLEDQLPTTTDPVPVGVGTPGVCDAATGQMMSCNSTWLNGQRLPADLENYLSRTICIANDADCFALSQSLLQPTLASGLLFGVILGTGVGGGWVADGLLRTGPNGLSGEWGHMPLPYLRQPQSQDLAGLERGLPDRVCYCGRLNCIETFLSGPGLRVTHETLWSSPPGQASTEKITVAQDSESLLTMQLYCDMLARSLAQVINVVDPQNIVLGGGLSNVALLYDALPRQIPAYLFSRAALLTPINAPVSGDDSGVIGAALLTVAAASRT